MNILKIIAYITIPGFLISFIIFILIRYFQLKAKYLDILKSMSKISTTVRGVRYGDFTRRITSEPDSRIKNIYDDINKMIESVEDRERIVKSYQLELENQKDYIESIFNSMTDGIIIVDNDGKILKTNFIVAEWLGVNKKSLYGHLFYDFFECACSNRCNPDNTIPLRSKFLSNNSTKYCEVSIKSAQAKDKKVYSVNSSDMFEHNGEHFVIALRDITKLKEIDNLRNDFVATLSHDLRVPLLAESNILKLFLKGIFGNISDKQKETLNSMLESNESLLELVNTLLDAYKYEACNETLLKEYVKPHKLIEKCLNEFMGLAGKNKQKLIGNCLHELPQVYVDKNEIIRVLRNLIHNALTYSPKGGIVEVNVTQTPEAVIFSVKDNGMGISESDINNIFDRYFSTAKKFRKVGTGLGLYLSKQIIDKHGGRIWVESIHGKGSTFFFTLPVKELVR